MPGDHGGLRAVVASSWVRFGLYLAVGSAIGAPLLIRWLVDGHGFAAALCITLLRLRRPLRPVPHRSQRSSARCLMDQIAHGTIADGHYGP
jgi:hypothetical protein